MDCMTSPTSKPRYGGDMPPVPLPGSVRCRRLVVRRREQGRGGTRTLLPTAKRPQPNEPAVTNRVAQDRSRRPSDPCAIERTQQGNGPNARDPGSSRGPRRPWSAPRGATAAPHRAATEIGSPPPRAVLQQTDLQSALQHPLPPHASRQSDVRSPIVIRHQSGPLRDADERLDRPG